MLLSVALLVAALAILILGADKLVGATEQIGLALGIPPFIMGITVLAVGTSLPELVTAMVAVSQGSPEMVAGTAIGSSIANILLILGVAAIVAKELKLNWDLLHGDLPVLFGSLLLLGFVAYPVSDADWLLFNEIQPLVDRERMATGQLAIISRGEGMILIIGYFLYLYYYAGRSKEMKSEDVPEAKVGWKQMMWLVVGGAGTMLGADWTVAAASDIATSMGLGQEIVAASLVAIGTSLPELVVSINAARRNNVEMAVGNVTGSNIFNIFMVIGVPAVAAPSMASGVSLPIGMSSTLMLQIPFYSVAVVLFLVIVLDKVLTRTEGLILLLAYTLFIGKLFSFF